MDLTYLANMTELEFEAERCRLIKEALDTAPTPELRKQGMLLQMQIDQRRETMPREQFIGSLFHDMNENLENISDQFVAIQHTIFPKQ
jgi:hypothetical protein